MKTQKENRSFNKCNLVDLLKLTLPTIIALIFILGLIYISTSKNESISNFSNFQVIVETPYLAYDKDTLVVYYMFNHSTTKGHRGYGYSYFGVYVNENGNYCRYIDGNLIEITTN